MAIDEALFIMAERGETLPVFRTYGWQCPAVSLGRFQQVAETVDRDYVCREGIEVVLRPTGGKAVYHDDDIVYALIAGYRDGIFPPHITETYAIISQCLAAGLRTLGVQVTFGPRRMESVGSTCCFASCAPAELCFQSRKILGSAQVRGRGRFLQHGSLLLTHHLDRVYDALLPHPTSRNEALTALSLQVAALSDCLPQGELERVHERVREAWCAAFSQLLDITWEEDDLTAKELEMASTLLAHKYRPWQQKFLLRA